MSSRSKRRIGRPSLVCCVLVVWLLGFMMGDLAVAQVKPAKNDKPAKKSDDGKGRRTTPRKPKRTPKVRSKPKKAAQDTKKAKDKNESETASAEGGEDSAKAPRKGGVKRDTAEPHDPVPATIDPELRRKIDELMLPEPGKSTKASRRGNQSKSRRSRAGSRGKTTDSASPAKSGSVGRRGSPTRGGAQAASGATTQINIAPSDEQVPPEQRRYMFSLKNATYEQLIQVVARQTGLGVMGEMPKGGNVTFVTDEELSFDELLARVRMLLFNYKPIEPYWMLRRETHLEVIRVNDILRVLPLDRMFSSVEDYRAANLPEYELALVIYTPKSGSIASLNIVRDFMPDYVRVTPLEDQNRVTIFAMVKDIEKYLDLIDIFVGRKGDPRTLEVIKIKFISPSEALDKLATLMELDGAGGRARPSASRGRASARDSALSGVREPEVSIVPEDAQGVLIVRAMADKIAEIKELLPYVDVDTVKRFDPVIIEVKHADPADLILTLEEMLSDVGGESSGSAAVKKVRRKVGKRRTGSGPQTASIREITLTTHPTRSAIIVKASTADVDRVRKLIEMFDVAGELDLIRIELKHVDGEVVVDAVMQVFGGSAKGGKSAAADFKLVPDPSGGTLWFSGSEANLKKVRTLIDSIDVGGREPNLHMVRVVHQSPSFVASILEAYLTGEAPKSSGTKAQRRGKKARSRPKGGTGGRFTADDEQGVLYVMCTDDEWAKFEPLIKQLDVPAENTGFEIVAVENIDPADAIAKLTNVLGYGDPKGGGTVRFETTEGALLVMNATETQLADIKKVLKEFDTIAEIIERHFEIKHTDPEELISFIEQLLADAHGLSGGKRAVSGRKKATSTASGSDLTIVQLGRHLIVRTTAEKMERVADLIAQFDVLGDEPELRVYTDFAPGADLDGIAKTLTEMMTAKHEPVAKSKARKIGPTAVEGARFIPHPDTGQLLVVARPDMFAEIEQLIDVLRTEAEVDPIVREYISIKHADPAGIVEQVEPLLQLTVNRFIAMGLIKGSAVNQGSKPRAGQRKAATGGGKPFYFAADEHNERVVISGPQLVVDEAVSLVADFDRPTPQGDQLKVVFVAIKYADPNELVQAIQPLLDLKVQELVSRGVISDKRSATRSPARKGAKPGSRKTGRVTGDRYHLEPDARNGRIAIAAPQAIIDEVVALIDEFDQEVDGPDAVIVEYIDIEHSDPDELIAVVEPLLAIKVRALVSAGELFVEPEATGSPTTRKIKKSAAAGKRGSENRFQLIADHRNGRIVIAAPQKIVDVAVELVREFDKPGVGTETVFRIVDLERSNAETMVATIKEIMGSKGKTSVARKGGAKVGATASTPYRGLVLTATPSGRSLILRGLVEDVDQAEEWIKIIDAEGGGGRKIKVYAIVNADLETLVDVIMNSVDAPEVTRGVGKKRSKAKPRGTIGGFDEDEDDFFSTTITKIGATIYIKADKIDQSMIVSTSASQMAEVDAIVEQFEKEVPSAPSLPKRVFQLLDADAFYAVDELRMLLDEVWEPSNSIPNVDYSSFSNSLIVKYPDESRLAEVGELIVRFIDKPDPAKTRIGRKIFVPPAETKMSAEELALWMKLSHPEFEIELIDVTPKRDQEFEVERVKPVRQASASPCVLPTAFLRSADALLIGAARQAEENPTPPDSDNAENADDAPPPAAPEDADQPSDEPAPERTTDDVIREAVRKLDRTVDKEDSAQRKNVDVPARSTSFGSQRAKKLKAYINQEDGTVIIEGEMRDLEDIPDWMDELKEEFDKSRAKPDIRIYRVKYIDVMLAKEILEEMFNATQQQRADVRRQQQQATQRQRQQQQQQRRQQQQQQQKGQSGQVQTGRGAQQRQTRNQQPAQLPVAAVRIKANPRDRTLILRAETYQYAAILELLATIDQPKPIDSEHRIFQLKKLNAADVEGLLRDWLGLNAVASQPRRQTGSAGSARRGGRQGVAARSRTTSTSTATLPKNLMQKTYSGELGIDPKDIKISSNEDNNTILVMAPVVALDYIEQIITELESYEIAEREWKSYELENARVEIVESYLVSRYIDGENAGKKRGSKARGSKSAAPGMGGRLNTPTFVSYPRLNLLSVQATQEQLAEIDELIVQLDVKTGDEEFLSIPLKHADAASVAETLSSMFGTGAKVGQKRGRKSADVSQTGPKFIGEDGGRIVFYSAPADLHEKIQHVVAQLETDAVTPEKVHVIELKFAKASDVAAAIKEAYGGQRRSGGGRRGGKGGGGSTAQLSVVADNASRRVLVRTDEETFEEIKSLVTAMDVERNTPFEFRIYKLQFADARQVYETMKALLTDYTKQIGRDGDGMDPFSVEVDDQANALVVLGSPMIFGFVEDTLRTIDIEENKFVAPEVMIVAMAVADAMEVAQTINKLYAKSSQKGGEEPPHAEGNRVTNTLIVRGSKKQIEEIRTNIVEPLESQEPTKLLTEAVVLKHAKAVEVAEVINKVYEDKKRAQTSAGGASNQRPKWDLAVAVTAEPGTNQVIIQANSTQMAFIKNLIVQLDSEDVNQDDVHVVYLKNADAEAVAKTLTDIFVKAKSSKRGGGAAPEVSISALGGSRAIVVRCKSHDFADIEMAVAELDIDPTSLGEAVRVVNLLYEDAESVKDAVQEYLRRPGKAGRGDELVGDVRLSVLAATNAVVVSGDKQRVEHIEKLIQQMDIAGEKGSVPQIIALKYASVAQILPSIQEMFEQESRSGRRNQDPPIIVGNEMLNAIIVRGPQTDVTAIEALVEKLDIEEAKNKKNFRLVAIGTGVNLMDLADKVQVSVNEGAAAQAASGKGSKIPSVTVVADKAAGLLIVSGSHMLFDEAEQLALALSDSASKAGIGMKIITLGRTPAQDIMRLIDQLKGESSGRRGRSTGRSSGRRSGAGARPSRRPTGGGQRRNR